MHLGPLGPRGGGGGGGVFETYAQRQDALRVARAGVKEPETHLFLSGINIVTCMCM